MAHLYATVFGSVVHLLENERRRSGPATLGLGATPASATDTACSLAPEPGASHAGNEPLFEQHLTLRVGVGCPAERTTVGNLSLHAAFLAADKLRIVGAAVGSARVYQRIGGALKTIVGIARCLPGCVARTLWRPVFMSAKGKKQSARPYAVLECAPIAPYTSGYVAPRIAAAPAPADAPAAFAVDGVRLPDLLRDAGDERRLHAVAPLIAPVVAAPAAQRVGGNGLLPQYPGTAGGKVAKRLAEAGKIVSRAEGQRLGMPATTYRCALRIVARGAA